VALVQPAAGQAFFGMVAALTVAARLVAGLAVPQLAGAAVVFAGVS
jgi:hypothetical protein